jgi:phosphoribosylanthranilate isomerase
MAIEAGAYALGLVGAMPSGPGVITDEMIAEIAAWAPTEIKTFLLTSETSVEGIVQHYERVKTTTIQIVDALTEGTYEALRRALPKVELVQVIHVIDQSSVEEALTIAPNVDTLLLDSGNPNLAVKELGGTGRTHNWALSQQIVAEASVPVFLAGGLKSANVQQAIQQVGPFGLDLCSGVRSNGNLDTEKLNAFFAAVQAS